MPNTTKPAAEKAPAAEKRVEIMVPRGYANEDSNMFISVNGVNYLLPRGKKSMVPEHVAKEFYRAMKAQERLDETVDALLESAK